jgi:hypothetical protein
MKQEQDINALIKKFPHVDESIIYSTYFEQTSCDFGQTETLISQ